MPQNRPLPSKSNHTNQTRTMLVVDDSRVSRLFSRQYLLELHPDWVVEEAASAEEGLARLQSVTADFILLDVNMPGMGGMAMVERLRERHPAARICVLTANIQDATRDKALALGVDFAAKPITLARMAEILAALEAR